MTETDILTLTAFFDRREDADRASDRLVALGLPRGRVTVMAGRETASGPEPGGPSLSDAALDYFLPESDRHGYAEGLSRGGRLVVARNVPRELHDSAVAALEEEGAVDIDERRALWGAEGEGPVPAAVRGTTKDVAWTNPHTGPGHADEDAGDVPTDPNRDEAGPDPSGGRGRVRAWYHTGP
ncbi:hypothetical protein LAZ40_17355 [Cereibacter sphaeroides]|uniref:hypothetical protein n=1 Tax=Rhodobacterales TaxID=204455 RepID=UPI000BBE179B|nr:MULTISPECIES: hypothetical protein [Paracoccaceae]MCE6960796.1 hypothetical protein [Cereibacter sphaeroides]MCE6969938.1 hypothetical protein [Cereibacter sphaeroides]MCE6974326.1 hypothetical protein [Cereibacter sphaeroides]